MTTQSATVMQRTKGTERVNQGSEEIFNQFSQINDVIARRAFELFENRGGSPGHEIEDWSRAESELLHPLSLNVYESDSEYIVRAEAPGFGSKEIGISVEGRRLAISGKREKKEGEEAWKTIRSEWGPDRVFRTLDLLSEVDVSKVSTTLKDGILIVDLPKAQVKE
jgi:HSP20 family protein